MCGIVGTLVFDGSDFRVTQTYVNRMRDSMAHRGPDNAGTWVAPDGKLGLGHRRLSIIDLSYEASQPMSSRDGALWITFNGEIYNHAEIRKDLEALGHNAWKTDHSDTEVILNAYRQWGVDCLEKFRGMFAFALWDANARALWLVRDRMGIKPLYYSIHNQRITFASEIKALLEDPDQKRAVDEESFFHYLSFLATPPPCTMFEGISKLASGTWLLIKATGELRVHRYWDVLDHTVALQGRSEDEVAEQLLAELRSAVKLRTVSDVPVGVFLSGGIDSSVNTALLSESGTGTVRTFSIGYEGQYESYPNELPYARRMADEVKAEYHERLLRISDLIDFLPQMIRLQDEPIANPVCVPLFYVSKLARDNGVIVCLVGEGSDELFMGYPGWKRLLTLSRLNDLPVPRAAKRLALWGFGLSGNDLSFRYERLRRAASGEPVVWSGSELFTDAQKMRLISPRLRQKFLSFSSWEAVKPVRERFEEKAWEPSHLNWMTYMDLNLRLPELVLMRVDKMSMAVGVESRVPYLDHRLVELVMSIPEALKVRNGALKYILKRSVRGLIPNELIDRKKQGFGIPVYEWILGHLGARARQDLDDFCQQTDFLDRERVLRWVEDATLNRRSGPSGGRRRNQVPSQIWSLLIFALWWKAYVR